MFKNSVTSYFTINVRFIWRREFLEMKLGDSLTQKQMKIFNVLYGLK